MVGAAIIRDGRCLVAQRGPTMRAAGRWEFPGGKVEDGEDPRTALARELFEELGVRASIGALVGRGEAPHGDLHVVLDVHAASLREGEPTAREHSQLAWLAADDLAALDWAEPDIPVVPHVARLLRAT